MQSVLNIHSHTNNGGKKNAQRNIKQQALRTGDQCYYRLCYGVQNIRSNYVEYSNLVITKGMTRYVSLDRRQQNVACAFDLVNGSSLLLCQVINHCTRLGRFDSSAGM